MTAPYQGRRTPAVVCPGCGSNVWESRLSEVLDEAGGVSAVYRVLVGRRGHRSGPGSGPSADWAMSYSRVQEAPERVQATLRALGRRVLRNLLDLGWVDEGDVRRAAGLDTAVEAEVSRRAAEEARLRASVSAYASPHPPTSYAPPSPRIPVQRMEPRTADLSRFGSKP